jgi:hypothetical protein
LDGQDIVKQTGHQADVVYAATRAGATRAGAGVCRRRGKRMYRLAGMKRGVIIELLQAFTSAFAD